MSQIKEIMTKDVVSVLPADSALKVVRAMAKRRISSVVVISSKKSQVPVGIITERDLTGKILAKDKRPDQFSAADIMSSPVITAPSSMDFMKATELIKRHKVRRLVIVDHGRLAGIVTQTDLLKVTNEFLVSIAEQIEDVAKRI